MNTVLAIVVTYNRLEMLKKCVAHLQAQTFPCDILIVDNASTDGTRAWAAGLNSKEARNLIKGGRPQNNALSNGSPFNAGTRFHADTRKNADSRFHADTHSNTDSRFHADTHSNADSRFHADTHMNTGTQFNADTHLNAGSRLNTVPSTNTPRKRPKVVPVDVWSADTVMMTATVLWDDDAMHRVIYENTGENLGGAGGFQYGMRRAAELGYEYAWVMDDDAFAEQDCLEKLMHEADRIGDFGFLTSAVLWKDGSLCRMNWQRKYPTPKKRSERHLLESDLNKKLVQIQSSTFVSALFPVKIIREVGLPIKEFFIWCDDIEFTRRITLKYRHPAYVVTSSRIVHHIRNNEGTNIAMDDVERIPRYNYAFRNENYMYRQYGLKGFGYYLVVIAFNTLQILLHSPNHKGARLKVVWKNLFTGLSFNPKIEKL